MSTKTFSRMSAMLNFILLGMPVAAAAQAGPDYVLASCSSPSNSGCREEQRFKQPRASGKCEAARTAFLKANPTRSAGCMAAVVKMPAQGQK